MEECGEDEQGQESHLALNAEKLQELGEMKKRLKEMEDEAAALREMQAKVEKEMTAAFQVEIVDASKEEVDSRSVFVGNDDPSKDETALLVVTEETPTSTTQVDYTCTSEEVQQHFQSCGLVNRVTIRTDKSGQPMGFAYVEFVEIESVQEALQLNDSELHGRQLKVVAKRTNIPGMKQFRPRRFNPYMGGHPRRFHPYMGHPQRVTYMGHPQHVMK